MMATPRPRHQRAPWSGLRPSEEPQAPKPPKQSTMPVCSAPLAGSRIPWLFSQLLLWLCVTSGKPLALSGLPSSVTQGL